MIKRLRRRFVLIATASVLSVVALIFGIMLILNISSMNRNMDVLADKVSEGGGIFPGSFENSFMPNKIPPQNESDFEFITPETPFSTRHFTVFFDKTGKVVQTFTDSIYSITENQAVAYAEEVLDLFDERGWISNYRYKLFRTDFGYGVVFVDGSMNRSALTQSMAISAMVLFSCGALVLLLIFLFSKKAVKPIAESYEKQKQFITDANHELKTPLTLILANVDIAESEFGENEWLNDIRSEGNRMTELVNQLVALSRMDEENYSLNHSDLYFGKLVADTVAEFEPLAKSRNKSLEFDVDTTVIYNGDELLLRKLLGILMDNAIKYCDQDGEIRVSLSKKGNHPVICVENTYNNVNSIEFEKLFDRFYRADKARTASGSFGIGLSIAKEIAKKHKGDIVAYKKDTGKIVFKVTLK